MILQGIAHVVQAQRVSELSEKHGDQMGPGTEGAGFLVHAALAGDFRTLLTNIR